MRQDPAVGFTVGIFASLDKSYEMDPQTGEYGYVEHLIYHVHDWCDENGIAHYSKDGHVLVETHSFQLTAPVTREFVVQGMIAGLTAKKTEIQAGAQVQITAIDAKISELLCLPFNPTVQESGFAPRAKRDNSGAADVDDLYL